MMNLTNYNLLSYYLVTVRLVGSDHHNRGRVEIYYNGEWGTVCDDEWDDNDARVVCRQLGYYSTVNAYKSAYYGKGIGSIWLNMVSCIGNESKIADCGKFGIATENCTHFKDAGVYCHGDRRKHLLELI